jgi:hypothetical protein
MVIEAQEHKGLHATALLGPVNVAVWIGPEYRVALRESRHRQEPLYQYDFQLDGRQFRSSTEVASKAEAR